MYCKNKNYTYSNNTKLYFNYILKHYILAGPLLANSEGTTESQISFREDFREK
jgi:hypothetical protein